MPTLRRISPCLWFADQAEQAANFYVGVFPNSRITAITRYGEAGKEIHRRAAGSVMTIAFELDGQPLTALNGGPIFQFNEAVSLQVFCDTQDEIDHYWRQLGAGGDPNAQVCGWLKDRWGLSWQVVPRVMETWFEQGMDAAAERAMVAMLAMKKMDIAALEKAYRGA
ncbi:MAG: VOC family protein [Gemmatimonadetes bacterium]|nr:VOC family protein [Gemmatimonadota bacterium]